jgi:hypothetical protein
MTSHEFSRGSVRSFAPNGRTRLGAEVSDATEEILARGLARPEDERAVAIDEACANQPELASELRSRVAALRSMGIELEETHGLPEQLGDFRPIERLGGGGMSVV